METEGLEAKGAMADAAHIRDLLEAISTDSQQQGLDGHVPHFLQAIAEHLFEVQRQMFSVGQSLLVAGSVVALVAQCLFLLGFVLNNGKSFR